MNWYKNAWKDKLPGSENDNKKPSDFPKKDVERGMKVEREHSNNPEIAKEITLDHLDEHEDYYVGLEHMEKALTEMEKRKKK